MTRQARSSTEVLKATKWILENVGWIQGEEARTDAKGEFTGFCLIGAISHIDSTTSQVRGRARARIYASLPNKFTTIVDFNDDPKTTKKKVLNVIDRALKSGVKK